MKHLVTGIILRMTDKITALKILLSHFVLTCRHEPSLHAGTLPLPGRHLKKHQISFSDVTNLWVCIPELRTNGTPFVH